MFARKNIVILLSLFALSVDIFPLENRSKTAPRGSVVATKKLKKDSKKNGDIGNSEHIVKSGANQKWIALCAAIAAGTASGLLLKYGGIAPHSCNHKDSKVGKLACNGAHLFAHCVADAGIGVLAGIVTYAISNGFVGKTTKESFEEIEDAIQDDLISQNDFSMIVEMAWGDRGFSGEKELTDDEFVERIQSLRDQSLPIEAAVAILERIILEAGCSSNPVTDEEKAFLEKSVDAARNRISLIKLNFKIDSGEKLIRWRERLGIGVAKDPQEEATE
jgi:hypothetical protein